MILKSGELPFGGEICRIAVVPFSNQTKYNVAETMFSRVFVSELISGGNYLVAHEGDVRGILTQMHKLPGSTLSSEQIRGLADRLGVQVVITGAILEVRGKGASQRSAPSLAVVVRILEASSGRTLWTTYGRAEGNESRIIMHFGVINSVSALAKKLSAEIIKVWRKEGFQKCIE